MRSPLRSSILVIPLLLAATLISAPTAEAYALASPVTFPMPFRNADYEGRLVPIPHATRRSAGKRSRLYGHIDHTKARPKKGRLDAPVNASSVDHVKSAPPVRNAVYAFRRDFSNLGTLTGILSDNRDDALTNSQDLQTMASQSAAQNQDDASFQQNAAAKASSFQSNIQTFQTLLGELFADKGLANYDKTDELETILKDIVNAHKDALSALTTMVYNVPTLGPILGPIVYEVKCIIDDVLDATENLSDGLMNGISSLMPGLLGKANDLACSSQIKLLGLCL